jgi:hypothetical protein
VRVVHNQVKCHQRTQSPSVRIQIFYMHLFDFFLFFFFLFFPRTPNDPDPCDTIYREVGRQCKNAIDSIELLEMLGKGEVDLVVHVGIAKG